MLGIVEAVQSVPQNLQALGLLVPALVGCCYANFTRQGAIKYFYDSHYYDRTHIGVLDFLKGAFEVHDHPTGGVKPEKNEYVVFVPVKDAKDKVRVNKDDIVIVPGSFLKEGEFIPGTSDKHRHDSKGFKGPWES